MVKLSVDFLKRIKGVKKIIGSRENEFSSFAYDSRLIKGGELFFAFKTDKNDGNNYIESALKKGAKGYIGQKEIQIENGFTGIIVDDTHEFLYNVAKEILRKSSAKVIALTGSAGKTTTKEFLAFILEGFYKTFKTPKNFNSDIGVPLGILEKFEEETEVAVFELGTNRFGEIEKNSLMIKPDIAAILNILRTHLEKLGTVEGVIRAKEEIFAGLKKDGKILLNFDNEFTKKIGDRYREKIFFGMSEGANFRFNIIKRDLLNGTRLAFTDGKEREIFQSNIFLSTHIENLIAAISLAKALGLKSKKIMERVKLLKPYIHRGEIIKINNSLILDDSYNSNPDALKLILNDFKLIKGKKIIIVGEILELGEKSVQIHKEVASYFEELKDKVDRIYFVQGDMIYPYQILREKKEWSERVFFYDSYKEFRERFLSLLNEDVSILIKGSHGTNLYKLVEEVKDGIEK